MVNNFITKDSGKRIDFKSGMKRDVQTDKPRFDLIIAEDTKYEDSLLYRWAMLLQRGANKYGERNWEKSNSIEELNRFKASLWRHFMAFMNNVSDGEDHAAAICFNLNAIIRLQSNYKDLNTYKSIIKLEKGGNHASQKTKNSH